MTVLLVCTRLTCVCGVQYRTLLTLSLCSLRSDMTARPGGCSPLPSHYPILSFHKMCGYCFLCNWTQKPTFLDCLPFNSTIARKEYAISQDSCHAISAECHSIRFTTSYCVCLFRPIYDRISSTNSNNNYQKEPVESSKIKLYSICRSPLPTDHDT